MRLSDQAEAEILDSLRAAAAEQPGARHIVSLRHPTATVGDVQAALADEHRIITSSRVGGIRASLHLDNGEDDVQALSEASSRSAAARTGCAVTGSRAARHSRRPAGYGHSDATCQHSPYEEDAMAVTAFQDLPLADRDREWDGTAAEKRVRDWADAQDEPNQKYRDAHVWYDAEKKDNFSSYKLLVADVVDGRLRAVPRGVMAAGNVMEGSRGGVDLPKGDIDRVRSHLAKYYSKMGDTAPWER